MFKVILISLILILTMSNGITNHSNQENYHTTNYFNQNIRYQNPLVNISNLTPNTVIHNYSNNNSNVYNSNRYHPYTNLSNNSIINNVVQNNNLSILTPNQTVINNNQNTLNGAFNLNHFANQGQIYQPINIINQGSVNTANFPSIQV